MREFEIAFPAQKSPSKGDFVNASAKAMGVAVSSIKDVSIIRRSLDARSKEILYRYRVRAFTNSDILPDVPLVGSFKDVSQSKPVVVIGAGPAGSFAAVKLIQLGYKPIIIERGKDVHSRKRDLASISTKGVVDRDSNYCFGEGGAGTYSDGKLYTRSNKRGDVGEILRLLVSFGADESILIDAHPHIGSDRLPLIMENLRNRVVEYGGEYHFGMRMTDLKRVGKEWVVECTKSDAINEKYFFQAEDVILATGHSAKDVYKLFAEKRWEIEAKGFALGVRVEHPQCLINDIQYHGRYRQWLPPAEYSLVTQVDGRGVFSFCMCPGGLLVPSSTDSSSVVLNGMSNSMRNSRWANAGMVVSIEPQDVCSSTNSYEDSLSLLHLQEEIERRAFEVSGSLKAPAQRMTDFVKSRHGRGSTSGQLPRSSYFCGTCSASLDDVLPEMVACRLKKAFPLFDKKMKGYYTSEALLLAVESRTSSPVRIPRNPGTLEHISQHRLYPCGEGAGYSGGIISSALDGVAVAQKIALK